MSAAPAPPSTAALALPRWVSVSTWILAGLAPLVTWLARMGEDDPLRLRIFDRLFAFNDHRQALAMLAGWLAATLLLRRWPAIGLHLDALAESIGRRPAPWVGGTLLALALGARFVYLAQPLAMDEVAPWLQAQAFAHGELSLHYAPELLARLVAPREQGLFILMNPATGDAASAYWPGLALLMAPLAAVGLPWLLNPAFTALALALIHRLVRDATGQPRAAGWAVLVALASPQFSVNAMSFYAMPGLLALNLLYLWLLLRPGRLSAWLAGSVGGLALVLHNPVPHALLAGPCLLWLAADRPGRRRLPWLLAGYLPPALLLGLGWPLLTAGLGLLRHGAAATAAAPAASDGGFLAGWLARLAGVFAWPDGMMLVARWQALWKLWIWAAPGLLLCLPLALAPAARRPPQTALRLMAAGLLLSLLFYFFVVYDQGHGWGYRYLHPVWGALPLAAGAWVATRSAAVDPRARHGALTWLARMVLAGALATPVCLWQTHATVQAALAWQPAVPGSGEWLVFVAARPGQYDGDLVRNTGCAPRVLLLLSRGPLQDRQLVERLFPGAVLATEDQRGSTWRRAPGGTPCGQRP